MNTYAALLVVPLAACGTGISDLSSPLCQRPEVLEDVARLVKKVDYYAVLDDTTVREGPSGRANAIDCRIETLSVGYIQSAIGTERRPIRQQRHYDVQFVQNRYSVRLLP